MGCPSRSHRYVLGSTDDGLPTDALGSRWRVPLSHVYTPHCVLITYIDKFDRQRSAQVYNNTNFIKILIIMIFSHINTMI